MFRYNNSVVSNYSVVLNYIWLQNKHTNSFDVRNMFSVYCFHVYNMNSDSTNIKFNLILNFFYI